MRFMTKNPDPIQNHAPGNAHPKTIGTEPLKFSGNFPCAPRGSAVNHYARSEFQNRPGTR